MDENGAGEFDGGNLDDTSYSYDNYYDFATPAEGPVGDPPSNRWWQDPLNTVVSSASNIIATRQAAARPSNQNPAAGGAGRNAQANTQPGAGRVGMFGGAPGAALAMSPLLIIALVVGAVFLFRRR